MRRLRGRTGWPETIFVAVVVIAFLAGGFLFGRPIELLVTCGGFVDCTGMRDRYVEFNAGAGVISGFVAALTLVLLGIRRQRRWR